MGIQFHRRLTKFDLQDIVAVLLIAVGVTWLIFTPWESLWHDDVSASVTFFFRVIPGVLVSIGGISLLSVFSKEQNAQGMSQTPRFVKDLRLLTFGMAGIFALIPLILILCILAIVVYFGIATRSEYRIVMMDALREKPIVTMGAIVLLGVVLIGICCLGYWRTKRNFLVTGELVRGAPKLRSLPLHTRILIVVSIVMLLLLHLSERLGMLPH